MSRGPGPWWIGSYRIGRYREGSSSVLSTQEVGRKAAKEMWPDHASQKTLCQPPVFLVVLFVVFASLACTTCSSLFFSSSAFVSP